MIHFPVLVTITKRDFLIRLELDLFSLPEILSNENVLQIYREFRFFKAKHRSQTCASILIFPLNFVLKYFSTRLFVFFGAAKIHK